MQQVQLAFSVRPPRRLSGAIRRGDAYATRRGSMVWRERALSANVWNLPTAVKTSDSRASLTHQGIGRWVMYNNRRSE